MNEFELSVGGRDYTVRVEDADPASPDLVNVVVNGTSYSVRRCGGVPALRSPLPQSTPPPRRSPAAPQAAGEDGTVCAPMPGTVLAVLVKAGETVSAGQALLTLEAMKMETSLCAPCAGTVAALQVEAGQRVNTGDVLLRLS